PPVEVEDEVLERPLGAEHPGGPPRADDHPVPHGPGARAAVHDDPAREAPAVEEGDEPPVLAATGTAGAGGPDDPEEEGREWRPGHRGSRRGAVEYRRVRLALRIRPRIEQETRIMTAKSSAAILAVALRATAGIPAHEHGHDLAVPPAESLSVTD